MKRFDQINVIPFIDIMLVLLAIVLTTATFISQGLIEINLPEAESTQVSTSPETALEIAITNQTVDSVNDAMTGGFFLDGDAVTFAQLTEKLQAISPETPIVLRVDRSVPFERFVSVVDILKQSSLDKVSILTREK